MDRCYRKHTCWKAKSFETERYLGQSDFPSPQCSRIYRASAVTCNGLSEYAHCRRSSQNFYNIHIYPYRLSSAVGVHPSATSESLLQGLRLLGEAGGLRLQDQQPHGPRPALGAPEKQVQHDVREAVPGPPILLQDEHHQKGIGETTDLQVRHSFIIQLSYTIEEVGNRHDQFFRSESTQLNRNTLLRQSLCGRSFCWPTV